MRFRNPRPLASHSTAVPEVRTIPAWVAQLESGKPCPLILQSFGTSS